MDAQLKAKWVEALRSGEYRQTDGSLHDPFNDAYCCLGVLCRVAGAEFAEATVDDEEGVPYRLKHVPVLNGNVLSERDDEQLSKAVCTEFGIPDQSVLIQLNDGDGNPDDERSIRPHSFSEIAEFIEQNL